jgi:hypothetical protein
MDYLLRALLCILACLATFGCGPSPVQQMEASTAAAEQRLKALKEASNSGALEAEAEALRRSEEALALEKTSLAQQFEAQLQAQGWRPLVRGSDGAVKRYFLLGKVKEVGPGVLWMQTMTLSDDQSMTFTGVKLRALQKTWATADKPSRPVEADQYKPIEGTLDTEALLALTGKTGE